MARFLTRLLAALAVIAVWLTCPVSAEETCSRLKGQWLDLTPTDDGYLVPMSVAGTPHLFLLEFSAAYAILDQNLVDELKLPTKGMPHGMKVIHEKTAFTQIATAPTITLGIIPRHDAEFLVEAHREDWGPRADGVLGMNVFVGLDIELDLAHNKMALFFPGHCPFVPYWNYDVVGSAPFLVESTGITLLPMELDGRKLEVSIRTTNSKTYMPLTAAHMLLGIEEPDKALVTAGKNAKGEELYRYPFKTLSADNVTINNPDIYIYRNTEKLCGGTAGNWYNRVNSDHFCIGTGDIMLGWKELCQLRFFFDFKEKKVYFTPAEQQPLSTGPPPPAH